MQHTLFQKISLCLRCYRFFISHSRDILSQLWRHRASTRARSPTRAIEQHVPLTSSVFCMSRLCRVCIFWIISYVLGSLPWEQKNERYIQHGFSSLSSINQKSSTYLEFSPSMNVHRVFEFFFQSFASCSFSEKLALRMINFTPNQTVKHNHQLLFTSFLA